MVNVFALAAIVVAAVVSGIASAWFGMDSGRVERNR
ncbi:MAG: hypothetical protein JWN65_31 [Solirubrobacterales bacterium]|jgi:hypothetical protein|nr:hypothetical protein [Solirubrobacterales bacterium]